MNRTQLFAVLFAGLLIIPGVGIVSANTQQELNPQVTTVSPSGEPGLSVFVPDNELTPGQSEALTLQVQNDATVFRSGANPAATQEVTTARGVTVELNSNSDRISINTREQPLGSLRDGSVTPVTFEVVADEGISPGTYELEADVEYEYTRTVTDDGFRATRSVYREFDVEVQVTDDARFEIVDVSDELAVGDTGEVALTVEHTGGNAARGARLTVQSGSPDVTFGGAPSVTRYIGEIKEGDQRTVRFQTTATAGASAGGYPLTASMSFQSGDGVSKESVPLEFGVQLAERQAFTIAEVTDNLAVGDRGTVNFTVTNDGPFTVERATVALRPNGETVVPVEPDQPLGTLAPGESTTVSYPVRATEAAEAGPRQLSFVVEYQQNGNDGRSKPVFADVEVSNEQSFSLSAVESTLRVGAEGRFSFTVTNDGPNDISDAVLTLEPTGPTIQPQETRFAVGDLGVGESADVEFPIDVTDSGSPIGQQLSVAVEYRDINNDRRVSDPVNARVEVAPEQPVFALEGVSTELEAGSDGTVELRISNNGDENLTNINAKAFVNSPLSAVTDEAYVPSLGAGETTTIAFDLSVDSDAPLRSQPLELDFQYDEPDGDTKLTDTYQLPVEVTEASGGGLSTGTIVLIGVLALLAIGAVVYVRR